MHERFLLVSVIVFGMMMLLVLGFSSYLQHVGQRRNLKARTKGEIRSGLSGTADGSASVIGLPFKSCLRDLAIRLGQICHAKERRRDGPHQPAVYRGRLPEQAYGDHLLWGQGVVCGRTAFLLSFTPFVRHRAHGCHGADDHLYGGRELSDSFPLTFG